MDLKWLDDMYDSIKNYSKEKASIIENINHPDYKNKVNEIKILNDESDSLELSIAKIESRENLSKLGGLAIFFFLLGPLGVSFIFSMIGASIAYNSLNATNEVQKKRKMKQLKNKKAQINLKEKELDQIRKMISMKETEYSSSDKYVEADYYEVGSNSNGTFTSTYNTKEEKIRNSNENADEFIENFNKYEGSISEAKNAYNNLEKIAELLPNIKEFDNETYTLFNSAFEVSMKTAKYIKGSSSKETKAYIFYNHVETLYKWVKGISDLEEKDVYDSLLSNIKEKSKAALPVLIEKINKEYFKFVNPEIYDLESEMTVMSKDIF